MKKSAKNYQEYVDFLEKNESPYRQKDCLKRTAQVVKMSNGTFYIVRQPKLETSFCYGERGFDYDEAAAKARRVKEDPEFFISENLRQIDDLLQLFENEHRPIEMMTCGGRAYILAHYEKYEERYPLADEDRRNIIDAYKETRKDFVKHLNSYLKRYGLTKVRSWTFWVDA